jgi:hypothetical protein
MARFAGRSGALLIAGLFSVAVAGCAKTYWTKPGLTPAEWNRDIYECERDMRQSGYFGTGLVGHWNADAFQERCLIAKGYYKSTGDKTDGNTTPSNGPLPAQLDEYRTCANADCSKTTSQSTSTRRR